MTSRKSVDVTALTADLIAIIDWIMA